MRFFLLLLVTVYSISHRAQTVQVLGSVQDALTAKPVPMALLRAGSLSFNADSNGFFHVKLDAGQKVELKISKQDYQTLKLEFTPRVDTNVALFLVSSAVALDEVTVNSGKDNSFGISRLNNVEGTTIYAGKKSEVVHVQDLNANLAANNSRQVFSKVAGINVFENEGSGTTVGIGARGLNPNRISNFNTRQNGYDISADALGYPESYYTPPTEAVERIEILRGAAGLQFGTQFGGMINYRFTEPSTKKMAVNLRQTAGSFGFLNSFNQVSGTKGRLAYSAFYQYKHYDGWRVRSALSSHNAHCSVQWRVNDRLRLKAEYTFLTYLSQQPGGLTDLQFERDPTAVTRLRNWFRVNWNLFSISADYKAGDNGRFSLTSFGLIAGRDALGVLIRPDRADDTSARRNLLSDIYKNFGAELKYLHRYQVFSHNSHFLVGFRYYNGHTKREQGDASNGEAPEFNFLNPKKLENSSYSFPSLNHAFFVENVFQISKRWNITPGLRYEMISTASKGYYRIVNRNLADSIIYDQVVNDNRSNSRNFLLCGLGTQYKTAKFGELYANISQNYRSINFNDMRIANPNSQVDPNLRDERGFTIDGGFRGISKDLLYFDLGLFCLQYNDRIGTTLQLDSASFQIVRFRTNLGNSRSMGLEVFAELDWMKLVKAESKTKLSTFVNFSYINAVYQTSTAAFNNKKVEFVPDIILRSGITIAYNKFSFTLQYSYTGTQFSDATNALSSPSAIYGQIPSYSVLDGSLNYRWKTWGISAGVNNLANSRYFTRRADGYPGPGIIPADPMNFYLGLRFRT